MRASPHKGCKDVKTLVYHITFYDYDRSAYIQFLGCNFSYLGCIRRRYLWDHHLDNAETPRASRTIKTLMLSQLEEILARAIDELGLRKAVLGEVSQLLTQVSATS